MLRRCFWVQRISLSAYVLGRNQSLDIFMFVLVVFRTLTWTRTPGTIWRKCAALLPNVTWMSTSALDRSTCPGNLSFLLLLWRVSAVWEGLQDITRCMCVCVCFRQEADGKLYVRYQVLGRNHVAVPTHFFKVSPPVWWWWRRRWWWPDSCWVYLSRVSSGADPGAGGWQRGGASVVCFTEWTRGRENSSGAFPGSHRNHRESVRTSVCPEHHEEDQQPAGHHWQMNYTAHNALLLN